MHDSSVLICTSSLSGAELKSGKVSSLIRYPSGDLLVSLSGSSWPCGSKRSLLQLLRSMQR